VLLYYFIFWYQPKASLGRFLSWGVTETQKLLAVKWRRQSKESYEQCRKVEKDEVA